MYFKNDYQKSALQTRAPDRQTIIGSGVGF
jgi:hypothetical protein